MIDIFTNNNEGVRVYQQLQEFEGDERFTMVRNQLQTLRGEENQTLLISARDIPAIIDIDNDGDLDILTFDIRGSQVEYHQNLSEEINGNSEFLEYELVDECWGQFQENTISNDILLDVICEARNTQGHAGSTLLSLDLNGDELLDLILGDISFPNMVALINGGTSENAKMVAQDIGFPSANTPVFLPIFPAGFYLDIDKDDKKDLVVSPNGLNVSENNQSVWWYQNKGTSANPVLALQTTSLFQDQMIDLGEGAYPVVFDENQDGLMDLIVGNYGYYEGNNFPTSNYLGRLALFRNIGTATQPHFSLITRDWANISQYNLGPGLYPTFGDLDGDGDKDILLGKANGQISFFEYESLSQTFSLKADKFNDIDVGDFATPQLVDLNRDGLLDLVIGERSGNLNYYQHIGTDSQSLYKHITEQLGQVAVSDAFIPGYSIPQVFEFEGNFQLLVGSEKGYVFHYKEIEENLEGTFLLADTAFANINAGIRSAPLIHDWNTDGYMDLIIGNYAGGLSLLLGEPSLGSPLAKNYKFPFSIYPNPFEDVVHIEWKASPVQATIILRNTLGQNVQEINLILNTNHQLLTGRLPKGIYFLTLSGEDFSYHIKLLNLSY